MENTLNYSNVLETVKRYRKEFKRANVDASDIIALNDYIITETEQKKRNGKTYETIKKVISAENYMNNVTWITFFNARVTKSYTYVGYVMTGMSYKSPDGKESRTISWNFEQKNNWRSLVLNPNKCLQLAGFREKDVLNNCAYAVKNYDGGHEIITVYHTDGIHYIQWDNTYGKYTG